LEAFYFLFFYFFGVFCFLGFFILSVVVAWAPSRLIACGGKCGAWNTIQFLSPVLGTRFDSFRASGDLPLS
jgi:hypothetical protein